MRFNIWSKHHDNTPDCTQVAVELTDIDMSELIRGEKLILNIANTDGEIIQQVSVVTKFPRK